MIFWTFATFALLLGGWPVGILSRDDGLARTPPMGWMSWTRFACEVDCQEYPNDCINEKLYKDMIDRIASDGYLEAGYNYVNIDDCWMDMQRDPKTERLVPNATRFPSGIKALAEYAHSKKVLLGIYEDVGTMTCAQYPGTFSNGKDHTELDAQTFSDWTVDSLKVDGCYTDKKDFDARYLEYAKALSKVEHKIVYACEWPFYLRDVDDHHYEMIRNSCHYWRNFDDINDSYGSLKTIIDFYGQHHQQFTKFNGPGGWFDPDMLIIGNNGLSYEQSKTQMAFWCMWSVPLLMSNDLRQIGPEFKEILLNKHLIALDQDPLGILASRVYSNGNEQVWVKKLSPENKNDPNPWAVLYFNGNFLGPDKFMSFPLSKILPDLNPNSNYEAHDLFHNYNVVGTYKSNDELKLKVPMSGGVRLVKLVVKN